MFMCNYKRSIFFLAIKNPEISACLVIDTSLPAAQKAAAELGMPTVVLHTGSAAAIRLFRSYAMLHDKGYLPAQG